MIFLNIIFHDNVIICEFICKYKNDHIKIYLFSSFVSTETLLNKINVLINTLTDAWLLIN